MRHKHHIIPKHMGGTDDPSNIVELTIQEHADAHNLLYALHKSPYDKLAEAVLLGQMCPSEASKIAWEIGHKKGLAKSRLYWTGGSHTEETKEKMRQARLGKPNPASSAGCLKEVTCPHCGKVGQSGGMRRWHFNNCKEVTS